MNESERAIKFANEILDRPYSDPDDSLAMLSRQLLRSIERESQTEKKIIAKVREEIEEMRMASRNEIQNEIVLCKSDLLELPSLNIK